MKRIVKDARIVEDNWSIVTSGEISEFVVPEGDAKLILPLAFYVTLHQKAMLPRASQRLGVLLGPEDAPEDVLPYLAQLPLIAVHFNAFTDGRGYSIGRLIRMRYGFTGELRAVGDILRDQLYFLNQCGFNAFDLRSGQDIEEAVGAFEDYAWASKFSGRTGNR